MEKDLKPVHETPEFYDELERRIKLAFKLLLYRPLLKKFDSSWNATLVVNSRASLRAAIKAGRITYEGSRFVGTFSAEVSRELKRLGAEWDGTGFKADYAKMPLAIQRDILKADQAWSEAVSGAARVLDSKNLPELIAGTVKATHLFGSTISAVDREVRQSLKAFVVPAQISPAQRTLIAEEWQLNLEKWIKDFSEEQIIKLRDLVQEHALSGGRRDDLQRSIQKSFGVTARKAKFLARQETGLLMAKFKESRYTKANVLEYRWRCVAGSPKHPVRPSHKILDGKVFRWDTPPITTAQGEPTRRNNPGEDFNCRCVAVPVVRFKE